MCLKQISFSHITLIFGVIVIVIFFYGFLYEKNNVVLEKILIRKKSLAAELRTIKIIQFSDLHFKSIGIREKRVRKIINQIKPDVIFFSGDFFNSIEALENPIIFKNAVEYLSSLFFKQHFFFIVGEDEYIYRDYLKKVLIDLNITVLDNEIYSFYYRNTRCNVIGVNPDNKDLDAFYSNDKYHRNNIIRFSKFLTLSELNKYQNYRFYVGGPFTLKWQNYEINGQIQILSDNHTLGIAFYSQFPMGIYRSYFMELNPEKHVFCLNAIDNKNIYGSTCSELKIAPLRSYKFRIISKSNSSITKIRAKIWDSTEKEPNQWQIDCYDSGKNKSSRGTIGFSSLNSNLIHHIRVQMLDYDSNSTMFREGVREIPLNLKNKEIIPREEWMTLTDIKKLLYNKSRIDKPYLLEEKLKNIIGNNNLKGFNILLAHSPTIIKIAKNAGIDLVLSGHTHGGQIDIPLVDTFIHDSFEKHLLKGGLLSFSGTNLYINRGIGTSIIPIRLNCRPEITLFRLSDH
jgi:predicted MPP superfamily phosphohydrolase